MANTLSQNPDREDSYSNSGANIMSDTTNTAVARVQSLLDKMAPQLLKALPKHLTPERLTRIALTEMRKTPRLCDCNPLSFCGAIMMCAQLGLEPGGALGHIYLIPFKDEVQVILGYRGMIDLARRSGQIVSIEAHEVYENDLFEFEYGLEPKLRHKPTLKERGELIAVFAKATIVGGGYQVEVMSKPDVDKIRARSKSSQKGPWVTDYEEMAKKTVLRKLFKYLPVSIEIQKAAGLDEAGDRGEQFLDKEVEDFIEHDDVVAPESVKSQADSLSDTLGG